MFAYFSRLDISSMCAGNPVATKDCWSTLKHTTGNPMYSESLPGWKIPSCYVTQSCRIKAAQPRAPLAYPEDCSGWGVYCRQSPNPLIWKHFNLLPQYWLKTSISLLRQIGWPVCLGIAITSAQQPKSLC